MDELIKSILKLIDEVHELTVAVKLLSAIQSAGYDTNSSGLCDEDEGSPQKTYLDGKPMGVR